MPRWPSGLRRSTQVRVFNEGVGSNPTRGTLFFLPKKKRNICKQKIRVPRIELGTYCVLGSRHNQLDHTRAEMLTLKNSFSLLYFCQIISLNMNKKSTPRGTRTLNLKIRSLAPYPLGHGCLIRVRKPGIEPGTCRVWGGRHNQLDHSRILSMCLYAISGPLYSCIRKLQLFPKNTSAERFELPRGNPIWFLIKRLNRSAKLIVFAESSSASGTWTRVVWVKARYPNQLD